jgi:hypothetical protein
MSNNYRNPKVTHQDFMIARCFKKHLLAGNPELKSHNGYIPVWHWRDEEIIDYEHVTGDYFILPHAGPVSFRSILRGIQKDKPVAVYDVNHLDGTIEARQTASMSEADLMRVLKKLSLVIFSEADETKLKHFTGDEKFYVLKADQLSTEGRLGKIPLRTLLLKYIKHIISENNPGMTPDMDLDNQLLNEHRITKSEIEVFYNDAKDFRIGRKKCGKDKASRDLLGVVMSKKVDDFCEAVKSGGKRIVPVLPPKVVMPFVEDPTMKRNYEIRKAIITIHEINFAYRSELQRKEDPTTFGNLMSQLQNKHQLSEAQIGKLVRNYRGHRTHPISNKDTLSELIISIQGQAQPQPA